ncbi:MAG TPA: hypothetical protein VGU63_13335 [Candidatus Acidoferrales bacterium]|nr:hypothetical protein [Candidatus Acidoferrales bacterium]
MKRRLTRILVIVAALVLGFASIWRPKATAIGTILLLYVTFEYLLATRDNLDLSQEHFNLIERQMQRQERVYLHFDLINTEAELVLRVSNLGLSNFLLQRVQVRRSDAVNFDYDIHRIVQSGKTENIEMSSHLYEGMTFGGDFEFTLTYLGLDGSGKTAPKCYNVFLAKDDTPVDVREWLDDIINWGAHCPKCDVPALLNLHGLTTFDDAAARKVRMAEELGASCPNHKSEFILSDQAIRDRQRARDDQRRM